MNNVLLKKYAKLIVKTGVNLQPGQPLVIVSPIECAYFARVVAELAYQEGASEVTVHWKDELLAKVKFLFAPEKVFEKFPQWEKELYTDSVRAGAAFISIAASDPEILKDVKPDLVAKAQKAASTALAEYREKLMSNQNTWCVVSIPTVAWAKKVFPGMPETEAIEKLWQAILKTVRVDAQDPVVAWDEHKNNLKQKLDFLNTYKFKYLHYKNSLGTDLTVELPENHIWLGGSEYTPGKVEFIANMPTEEVFTVPKRTGVNGTVVSSKPLNYNGNLIENFSLTFKAGKVVDFKAKKGQDVLKNLLANDDGAAYLGEVALVPFDSPISNTNILFYNTLFDENASCHLALGKAYPVCLAGSENMDKDSLIVAGVNDSLVHEDFMVGTKDLEIIGTTAEGAQIPVFKNGNFAI
ncbi:MAG: peptidase aminopeptidase [Firmicutes bacterium]|nr:peptidase aminopeptidase [Bacillota bacterium]